MFEKFNQLAEQTATSASRRQFLERVGRGAMVIAAGLGAVLAGGGGVYAGRAPRICPAGSDSACVGYAEGTSCGTIDDPRGCYYSKKSNVCRCEAARSGPGKGPK